MMSNDDDGVVLINGVHVLLDDVFRFIIQRTGGFIKYQNAWVTQ
jgi:hypothetical protein